MSKTALFIRYIFFCLFFAVGAGSITLSFIAPEVLKNYQSIDQLRLTEIGNEKLQQRIDTYDKQIEMAKADPEILARLEKKVFGVEAPYENAAFPQSSQGLKELARKALSEGDDQIASSTKFRKYIEHSADKKNRLGLLYSGAALILISFVCFGAPKKQKPEAQGAVA